MLHEVSPFFTRDVGKLTYAGLLLGTEYIIFSQQFVSMQSHVEVIIVNTGLIYQISWCTKLSHIHLFKN